MASGRSEYKLNIDQSCYFYLGEHKWMCSEVHGMSVKCKAQGRGFKVKLTERCVVYWKMEDQNDLEQNVIETFIRYLV